MYNIYASNSGSSNRELDSTLPYPNGSTSSFSSTSMPFSDTADQVKVTPSLREERYGQTLGMRTSLQESSELEFSVGPSDLIHWGRYFGSQSSQYHENDFVFEKIKYEDRKDNDYYVGNYHYVNGLSFNKKHHDIDRYIFDIVGIKIVGDEFFLKYNIGNSSAKKEMVVTYCTYNIFNKSDFRARYVIHPAGPKRSIKVDRSYQIMPNQNYVDSKGRKGQNFSSATVKDLSSSYWDELNASSLIRLFTHIDNPSIQLTGLVSLSSFVNSKPALIDSIKILVKQLEKASLSGSKMAIGTPTGVGNKVNGKISQYKNFLVDALIKLCSMDISGSACTVAINEIRDMYYKNKQKVGEWDFVILRILKVQLGDNKEQEYMQLIHAHLKMSIYSTQSALILIEQVKFLISKGSYEIALLIAQKAANVLPLDFDAWYYLALCYILVGDFKKALLIINSIPIVMSSRQKKKDVDIINGIKDFFGETFAHRLSFDGEVITEKTFLSYFPNPKVSISNYPGRNTKNNSQSKSVDEGSIYKMWFELFLFNAHLRHPINGNQFYQSPLINSYPKELASVDPGLLKQCGPSSVRNIFSSQSAGLPSTSILDFQRSSTWGRCYDLLTFFVATLGWDNLINLKDGVFKKHRTPDPVVPCVSNESPDNSSQVMCEPWLEQIFIVIYEELKLLISLGKNITDNKHSALEWEMMGLLGYSVKYNLKESISSLITSVMGVSSAGGFDYFGTIKILEIYDEFILSDLCDSNIDLYHDDYSMTFFSNKLILKSKGETYISFTKILENDFLNLDFVLLILIKLISWNLRWYQYTPNHLVFKILTKLCIKYDSLYIRGRIRVIFEQNKKTKSPASKSSSKLMFSFFTTETPITKNYEFIDGDTIIEYINSLIQWIEDLKSPIAM